MRMGRQADLARDLGISRAAVSQAFKKHNIQLSIDGSFDLDYAAWLLKEKQCQEKSKAQRSANKQPPGIKNPRVRREIVRHLEPIFADAVFCTLKDLADGSFENDGDVSRLMDALNVMGCFWFSFHEACEREFPAELTDFPFKEPDIFQFDQMNGDEKKFLETLLGRKIGEVDE